MQQCIFLCLFLTVTPFVFAGNNFSPTQQLVRPAPSVLSTAPWAKALRFIVNRGPHAVHFQTELFKFLSPETLEKLPHYTTARRTRITYMAYELRSPEIVALISRQLKAGMHIRVITDPITFSLIEMPSEATWRHWSDHQKQYFIRQYRSDPQAAKFTQEDLWRSNAKRRLTAWAWKELQHLKKRYSNRVELITPPLEVVPPSDAYNYPRLTHLKMTLVETQAPSGRWEPQSAFISSANLTDSCLDHRIAKRDKNTGQCTYVEGSQGHIQAGFIVTNGDAIEALKGPMEEWIRHYQMGKHFDDIPLLDQLHPRVIFNDKKLDTPSTMQGFYSEGARIENNNPDERAPHDPVASMAEVLKRPDITVEEIYTSQYVFNHAAMTWHLRHHLASGNVKKIGIFVDGNFATQSYSTLPQLLFAPKIIDMRGILSKKAIHDILEIPDSVDWEHNTYVYEGDRGVVDGPGDKLHTKLTHIVYKDSTGLRHTYTVLGSGNFSSNAGRGNADALYAFDTVDPAVYDYWDAFFKALSKDERMVPYTTAYIAQRLFEMFPSQPSLSSPTFIQKLLNYFDKPEKGRSRRKLQTIAQHLARAAKPTAQGKRFIQTLEWHGKYSTSSFDWSDFAITMYLTSPDASLNTGFVSDLADRWMGEKPTATARRQFDKLIRSLIKSRKTPQIEESKAAQLITNHCLEALKAYHIGTYPRSSR